ncbi:MAG: hypothetical protein NTY88_09150 [Bacteroidetes bacterium]|nr:hypothetical protein [Bacteroidota bacterium]
MNLFEALKMTCKDASYLHEKKKEGNLSFTEMIGLKLHLLYCGLCRMFFKQLDELEKHTQRFAQSEKTIASLDATSKEKMKKAFEQQLKK